MSARLTAAYSEPCSREWVGPVQTALVAPADVDMEGNPIDDGFRSAVAIAYEQAPREPTFAGMWVDPGAREIHLAFTDSTANGIVAALQARVPPGIRLRAHNAPYSAATLEDLHHTYSEYMESTGYQPRYTVDSGVDIKANVVHANLQHTTPPEVIASIRARFDGAPLQIDLTTSRWTAY